MLKLLLKETTNISFDREMRNVSQIVGVPGGMNSVPLIPLSRMSILWTPGAMYDLSETTEAKGGCSLKPSTRWPLYMEMSVVMGVRTSNFLNLREESEEQTAKGTRRDRLCLNTRMCKLKNDDANQSL